MAKTSKTKITRPNKLPIASSFQFLNDGLIYLVLQISVKHKKTKLIILILTENLKSHLQIFLPFLDKNHLVDNQH